MGKRTAGQILEEMLALTVRPTCKTHIVYGAVLNFKTIMPYLRLLLKNGYLKMVMGNNAYERTPAGTAFMLKLHEINKVTAQLKYDQKTSPRYPAKLRDGKLHIDLDNPVME